MKHTDAERIASALILAFLIHLVIGIVLAFTVPWARALAERRTAIRRINGHDRFFMSALLVAFQYCIE